MLELLKLQVEEVLYLLWGRALGDVNTDAVIKAFESAGYKAEYREQKDLHG